MARTPRNAASETPDYATGKQDFGRNADRFFAWLGGYPQPENLNVVVYRKKPVIDRGLIGRKTNEIEKVADVSTFSRQYIAETHGNGTFRVYASDPMMKDCPERATCEVRIDDPDNDPILNPHELVLDDPANTQFVNKLLRKGILAVDANGKITVAGSQTATIEAPAAPVAAPAPASAPVVVQAAPAAPSLSEALLLKLLDKFGGQTSADDRLESAFKIAERFDRPSPTTDALTRLVDKLAERLEHQTGAATAPASQSLDLFEAYDRVDKVLEARAAKQGAGAGGGSIVAEILNGVAALANAAPQLVTAYRMFAAVRPAAPAPVAAPAQLMPPKQPYAVQPGSGFGRAAESEPSNPIPSNPQGDDDMKANLMMRLASNPALVNQLGAIAERALQKYIEGVDGETFAYGLCAYESNGREIFGMLRDMGAPVILQTLESVPELGQKLAPHRDGLRAWLDDFVSFDPDADGDDDEEPTDRRDD